MTKRRLALASSPVKCKRKAPETPRYRSPAVAGIRAKPKKPQTQAENDEEEEENEDGE